MENVQAQTAAYEVERELIVGARHRLEQLRSFTSVVKSEIAELNDQIAANDAAIAGQDSELKAQKMELNDKSKVARDLKSELKQ